MAVWDELFKRDEFRWKNPDQQVIELAARLGTDGAPCFLDLGCGAGRHLFYLAKQGFKTFGLDASENGLEHARRWLEQGGLEAGLVKADMVRVPYRDGFFDALISIHVIQHQSLDGIRKTAGEIRRVLRSGGLAYLTFPSRRDRRCGQGKEIEPFTFIAEAGPDSGVPHHYASLAEIEWLFEGFALRRVELEERTSEEGHRFSHWLVWAEKDS
jgi:SAM-dependent methyltransferase